MSNQCKAAAYDGTGMTMCVIINEKSVDFGLLKSW